MAGLKGRYIAIICLLFMFLIGSLWHYGQNSKRYLGTKNQVPQDSAREHTVNKKDKAEDEANNADEASHVKDEAGNVKDEAGNVKDEAGHVKDEAGHVKDEAGHTVSYKQLNIEKLEPEFHFRKNFYLGKTKDVENKDHLLKYLLGRYVNCSTYSRQILIDLGAKTFESSVGWFIENYPCNFTEIHAFEVRKNIFTIPEKEKARVKLYESFIGTVSSSSETDIADLIVNMLNVKSSDFLVIKMDIEGAEYKVIDHMRSKGLWPLIDEIFVEIHYKHPYMGRFGWDKFKEYTIEDATNLFVELRSNGVCAHPWP
ncbi:unnamed protein product [Owenia fusiformis]|uniref:DUF7870 domain-containing protein n=1 Tax=Owenia fusiformis TaxID=6347 RepID=A0A8J1Y4W2_OWEFU|nr:unnamed protein product [Owenia fusiformis]